MSPPPPFSRELLSASVILDALAEGALLIGPGNTVAWINTALARLLDIGRDALHGSDADRFVRRHLAPRIMDEACSEQITQSLRDQVDLTSLVCTIHLSNGVERRILISSATMQDEPFRGMRLVRLHAEPLECEPFLDDKRQRLLGEGERHAVGLATANKELKTASEKPEVANEELHARTEELQALLASLSEGVWAVDSDAQTTFVNDRMAEMLGYAVKELIGKPLTQFVNEKERERERERFRLEGGGGAGNVQREYTFIRKDGSHIDTLLAISPLCDSAGNYSGAIAGVLDITERKQAEEALRESEERFRLLTENASDIVVVLDPEGRILFASPSVQQAGGYALEDLVGRTGLDLVHPDDLPLVMDALRIASARPKERVSLEVRIRHASGDWRYFDVIGVNLTEEPAVRGFVVNARDITDRKRAEEALQKSEEQFRLAIEDAPIPIIMHAEDGEVLQISRTWTDLTGFTLQDAPTFDAWLSHAYGEGADAVRDHMQALFKGDRRSIGIEFPIRTRYGQTRHWSFSASSPGRLADGRRFIVGMAVDITERKRAEKVLARQTEDLIALNEEIEAARDESNMYLDIMTHDVRNANNVSSMYADLLVEILAGDPWLYARKLRDAIQRSSDILRNVATIRRLQQESDCLMPMNLDAVVREEIGNFPGMSIRYDSRRVDVLADGLLPVIFTNLIGNAVKFSAPDVEISIGIEEQDGEVLVTVADTGPGVPDEMKAKLFRRFERGMCMGKGEGLGLYLVRTLVERYGGKAWIEDRVPGRSEEGAAFRFTLKKA
jgi:PAS domain S-box-containing protein